MVQAILQAAECLDSGADKRIEYHASPTEYTRLQIAQEEKSDTTSSFYNGNEDEKKKVEDKMILARDFEERVTELFATGMARHSDTSADLKSRAACGRRNRRRPTNECSDQARPPSRRYCF